MDSPVPSPVPTPVRDSRSPTSVPRLGNHKRVTHKNKVNRALIYIFGALVILTLVAYALYLVRYQRRQRRRTPDEKVDIDDHGNDRKHDDDDRKDDDDAPA